MTPAGAAGRLQFLPGLPMIPGTVRFSPNAMEVELSETLVIVERRKHLALRVAFDDVYPHIEPLLDSTRTWGGAALTTFVYRVVRERCPGLSPEQAQILVAAAQRVHRTRRLPGAKPKAMAARPAVPA